MVVLFHALPTGIPGFFGDHRTETFVGRLVDNGNLGVSFFFFLSGYVLAHVYLRGGEVLDRRKFWVARFARIYPLFFVMLVLDTPVLLIPRIARYGMKMGILKTAVTFLANTAMLQAWSPLLLGINTSSWSLSTETLFYLSFPVIGVLLWRLRGRQILLVALLLYAVNFGIVYVVSSAGWRSGQSRPWRWLLSRNRPASSFAR